MEDASILGTRPLPLLKHMATTFALSSFTAVAAFLSSINFRLHFTSAVPYCSCPNSVGSEKNKTHSVTNNECEIA